MQIAELLSIYWVHIWKADFWNAMHIHCDFLTTSSPAEGKVRGIGGNCSWWRMRASCLITLASVSIARSVWQISQVVSMKLLHVTRRNLIRVHPIWTNLPKSNKNQNIGSLHKPGFYRAKLGFSHWTYNFLCLWSSWYVYIYIYISRGTPCVRSTTCHGYQTQILKNTGYNYFESIDIIFRRLDLSSLFVS